MTEEEVIAHIDNVKNIVEGTTIWLPSNSRAYDRAMRGRPCIARFTLKPRPLRVT